MASDDTVSATNFPVPYKIIEEANDHLIENPPKEHDDFIATLPPQPSLERPISVMPTSKLFKGFWVSEVVIRGALLMQQHFQSNTSDIFLASFPKSGTTWLKALLFASLTRTNYPLDQHPLRSYNPHQCLPYMDLEVAIGRSKLLEVIPSPRVMSTHLPYSLLPDSIKDSDCRIVYVWRDPKDVLVSHYCFVQKARGGVDKIATFDQFYEFFCKGIYNFGPIWNHILGYWEESKRRPEKILFLKYEHMLQEPVKFAKELAHFIGCPYTETEENQGVVEQIVELCSFKTLKDLDVNKVGSGMHIQNKNYFRKGEAGDWRSHMTQEMADRLDAIVEEKFVGSGLKI